MSIKTDVLQASLIEPLNINNNNEQTIMQVLPTDCDTINNNIEINNNQKILLTFSIFFTRFIGIKKQKLFWNHKFTYEQDKLLLTDDFRGNTDKIIINRLFIL